MSNNYVMRRFRRVERLRGLIRESVVNPEDFIWPIFIKEGIDAKESIQNMPGVYQYSLNEGLENIKVAERMGITAIVYRPIPQNFDNLRKKNEFLERTIYELRSACSDVAILVDNYFVMIDSEGFYGQKDRHEQLDTDKTLELLQDQSVVTAKSGGDVVITLGRVDNETKAVREALDENGLQNTPILSYAANFASNLAHAMHTDPKVAEVHKIGSLNSKIGIANVNEAIRQVMSAVRQGVDYIGVKPSFFNMDIITKIKEKVNLPVTTYVVSKEYAMIKAAHKAGYLDEKDTVDELNVSLKRAGADKIVTYWAREIVERLKF